MSIYQKQKGIISTCPAYDTIELEPANNGAINLKAEDQLHCLDYDYQSKFRINSVISSTLADGRDPMEALERAKRNGHEIHFIYGLCTCISAHDQPRETFIGVRIGDKVNFEGKTFEIQRANNNNLSLKEI